MRSIYWRLLFAILGVTAALVTATIAYAQASGPKPAANPYPYTPDEPTAAKFSRYKAGDYVNGVSEFWMQKNSCGACHANFAFLMLRPMLGEYSARHMRDTRQFLEQRQPDRRFSFDAEAVAIAFALAWDDAPTRRLQPATRGALQRMWALQKPNGYWSQMGCGDTLPSENDRHYTAALAALAAGVAPEGYARSPHAQDGLTKLRRYLHKNPPYSLHNHAMLLWASMHLDGLLTAKEREDTVKALLDRQHADGGWSLTGLSAALRHVEHRKQRSDGYGTGFAVFVLRQAGMPATRPEIIRGVAWLKSHQRVSGRWFTPAPVDPTEGGVGSRDLYAQNHATAFSLLALDACQALDRRLSPAVAAIVDLAGRLDEEDVPRRARHIVDSYDSCDISQVFTLRGAGIGSAVQAGHKNSIDHLVRNWAGPKPPTRDELQAHRNDLLDVARVLQAMAELAPHRAALFSNRDVQRIQDFQRVAAEFKSDTRGFRDAVSGGNPADVRRATVRLHQTCTACHKLVGI